MPILLGPQSALDSLEEGHGSWAGAGSVGVCRAEASVSAAGRGVAPRALDPLGPHLLSACCVLGPLWAGHGHGCPPPLLQWETSDCH